MAERLLDDLRDRLPRVERVVRALEHVLDLPSRVRVARSRSGGQRPSSERDLARIGDVQSGDAASERRLAGSGLADERQTLARPHDELDVVQDLSGSVRRVHSDDRRRARLRSRSRAAASPRSGLRRRRRGRRHGGCSAPRDRRTPARAAAGDRACLLGVRAPRCEEAARRPVAGPWRGTRDADEGMHSRHLGDRLDEPARVRMCGLPEERSGRPDLGESAAVHDRDAIGEGCDHGQVVAHVDRSDAVRRAEVAHRLEHVGLGGHVEPGRRLVQHDHARPVGERHRRARPAAAGRPTAGADSGAGTRRRSGAAPRRASRRCVRAAPRRTSRNRGPTASRRAASRSSAPGSARTRGPGGRRRRACLGAAGARAGGAGGCLDPRCGPPLGRLVRRDACDRAPRGRPSSSRIPTRRRGRGPRPRRRGTRCRPRCPRARRSRSPP